jgi:Leucine-rich repeat (LRR) protein
MTSQNQYFHPELIIVDHFDDIINQIDIKTESLTSKKILELDEKTYIYKWAGIQIETLLEDQSLININEAREKQIEKIKEIKQLNLSHLAQKSNLQSLSLSNNFLTKVNPFIFKSLIHLETLNLNNNLLDSLASNLFSRMKRLKTVRLSDNKLISIDRSIFIGLGLLEEVFLNGNPINSMLPSYVLRLCSTNSKCTIII